MAKTHFENLRIYQLSEDLSDKIWQIVLKWDQFARTPSELNWLDRPTVSERTLPKVVGAAATQITDGSLGSRAVLCTKPATG